MLAPVGPVADLVRYLDSSLFQSATAHAFATAVDVLVPRGYFALHFAPHLAHLLRDRVLGAAFRDLDYLLQLLFVEKTSELTSS